MPKMTTTMPTNIYSKTSGDEGNKFRSNANAALKFHSDDRKHNKKIEDLE